MEVTFQMGAIPGVRAVAGCGPAGLSAAIALRDPGQPVTLYARFEQPGPVGSGLMQQFIAELV